MNPKVRQEYSGGNFVTTYPSKTPGIKNLLLIHNQKNNHANFVCNYIHTEIERELPFGNRSSHFS